MVPCFLGCFWILKFYRLIRQLRTSDYDQSCTLFPVDVDSVLHPSYSVFWKCGLAMAVMTVCTWYFTWCSMNWVVLVYTHYLYSSCCTVTLYFRPVEWIWRWGNFALLKWFEWSFSVLVWSSDSTVRSSMCAHNCLPWCQALWDHQANRFWCGRRVGKRCGSRPRGPHSKRTRLQGADSDVRVHCTVMLVHSHWRCGYACMPEAPLSRTCAPNEPDLTKLLLQSFPLRTYPTELPIPSLLGRTSSSEPILPDPRSLQAKPE